MAHPLLRLVASLLGALALCGPAHAGGGDYVLDSGTERERRTVVRALEASSFPWDIVPTQVTIHITPGFGSFAAPGHIWLDSHLLATGRFSWAVVQDEYAGAGRETA